MTVKEIRSRVGKFKRLSRAGLYIHIRALKIKPLGVARPAIYPDDTADKIICRLGFVDGAFQARRNLLNNRQLSIRQKISKSRKLDRILVYGARAGGAR